MERQRNPGPDYRFHPGARVFELGRVGGQCEEKPALRPVLYVHCGDTLDFALTTLRKISMSVPPGKFGEPAVNTRLSANGFVMETER